MTPRAATEQRGIERSRTAPMHTLPGLVPVIDPLHSRIAFDHTLVVVVGMMGHRLESDDVPRFDCDEWWEALAEVAPVHGLVSRGNVIVADGAALEMGLRMGERRGVDAAQGSGTDTCLLDEAATRRVCWQRWTLCLQRLVLGEGCVMVIHA